MAAKAVEIGYNILQGKPAPTAPVLIPVTMIDKNPALRQTRSSYASAPLRRPGCRRRRR
jgi:hypothetical protein